MTETRFITMRNLTLGTFIVFICWSFGCQPLHSQSHQAAYGIFLSDGSSASLQQLIDSARQADVTFMGELHDDPIVHWIQGRVLDSLLEGTECAAALGLEMLERDQQLILNEYLQGLIEEEHYLENMRLWPNYETDYHPLVQTARKQGVPVYATNIPRRYANGVYRKGREYLDALSDQADNWIPTPFIEPDTSLHTYQSLLEMGAVHGGGERLLYAQAIKDAAMAEVIAKHSDVHSCFLHLNGAFHTQHKEGIAWYLKQLDNDLDIMTVTNARQTQIDSLDREQHETADFIITVPEDMIKTH